MKKQLFTLIFTFCIISFGTIFSQNSQYPKTKISGTEYYIYTVEEGEGLFGVARKFEVSLDELKNINPGTENGLKAGQQMFVPIKKEASKSANQTSSKAASLRQEYTLHKVENKQTLFAISKKYKVRQEDIIKANPEVSKGLTEGMTLRIPKTNSDKSNWVSEQNIVKAVKKVNNTKSEQNIHIVKENETLYSISRLYDVAVVDIVRLNPESSKKLSIGSELKIPSKNQVESKKDSNLSNSKSEVIAKKYSENYTSAKISSNGKVVKIAFLLPFMLDEEKQDPSDKRFIDFYSGALIAVHKAKLRGISCEIFTFDTGKSEQKITDVLANPELKDMDLIIGPAYSNQISLVTDFAKENKVNTLIPFSSKVYDIENNPYLFQFNPGVEAEFNFSANLLTSKYLNYNIVFAELPGISSSDEGRIWSDALKKELGKKRKTFSEIELITSDNADFKSVLKKNEKNLVIFNTDKYAYMSPFIAPLRSCTDQYEITLFEQYNWKNQHEKMPLSIYVSPFMSKYNPKELGDFNRLYTQLFKNDVNVDSPRFDLLGYDLSNYFISIIQRYGNKFIDKIGNISITNGIQSQPRFERISNESGFINQRLYLSEDKK
jgi:LysM repeat protein